MDANESTWTHVWPSLLLACLAWSAATPASATQAAPPVMLANVYDATVDVSQYWISEKYDGVRAYWDGTQLLTRAGNPIHCPDWFVAHWPSTPLDGELWIARGEFERISGTVRDLNPNDYAWRSIRYMVFDLPAHAGTFTERFGELSAAVERLGKPWVQAVTQFKVANGTELRDALERIVAVGGEGLMLHRGDSSYRADRSDDLLKLKPHQDAEAQVMGYLPGKGKYEGMMGALEVRRADGLVFRLGTGFNDAQRREPPAIGSWVTYTYNGLTAKGVPRFASFLRVRDGDRTEMDTAAPAPSARGPLQFLQRRR